MKCSLLILLSFSIYAQNPTDTEIFLFDITTESDMSLKFEKGNNISQNGAYDNQPSFYSENKLIYARTRNEQTDITAVTLEDYQDSWVSNTKQGSEFSPQRIPGTNDVAAVRLDTTGLQLLYRYKWESGKYEILLPNHVVGYFAFFDENIILTAVLNNNRMDLILNNLENKTSDILVTNIGRSIHKVPETGSMSYTVMNNENNHDLYLLDLSKENPESFFLCTLPEGVSDYAWLDENRILLGKGNQLFLYDMFGESKWISIANLSEYNMKNISRIAINKSSTRIAITAELLQNEE